MKRTSSVLPDYFADRRLQRLRSASDLRALFTLESDNWSPEAAQVSLADALNVVDVLGPKLNQYALKYNQLSDLEPSSQGDAMRDNTEAQLLAYNAYVHNYQDYLEEALGRSDLLDEDPALT